MPPEFNAKDMVNANNQTGFNQQIMVDLQRVLACLQVQGNNPKIDLKYLSAISKGSFSTKLVMAMNAQNEWRPGDQVSTRGSIIIRVIDSSIPHAP